MYSYKEPPVARAVRRGFLVCPTLSTVVLCLPESGGTTGLTGGAGLEGSMSYPSLERVLRPYLWVCHGPFEAMGESGGGRHVMLSLLLLFVICFALAIRCVSHIVNIIK